MRLLLSYGWVHVSALSFLPAGSSSILFVDSVTHYRPQCTVSVRVKARLNTVE